MPPPPQIDPAALLAAIIAWSDDAIVSKDLNGIITSWNGAAERMFGYSAAEAVGRRIDLIIPADRHSEEVSVLDRIRHGIAVEHFETIRVRKDGSQIPISLTVSPVRGADGVIVGASKIARDISDRRRTEAALASAQASEADLQRRLLTLVAASRSLLESPRITDVLPATLQLARELVVADGYAVWRLDSRSRGWRLASHSGMSEKFASTVIATNQGEPVSTLVSTEPMMFEDVDSAPILKQRREALGREGIRSLLAIPMTIRGEASATLVFYYRQRHQFGEAEIQAARALANLGAGAITTAELYEEQEQGHKQATFLAQIGGALAGSLDYAATLKVVATLAVPHIADWCAVDLAGDGGAVNRLAMAPADAAGMELAQVFQERYSEEPGSEYSVAHVIRTGKPVMLEQLTDDVIVASTRTDNQLRNPRALQISSFMIVPLLAHGRTLGALSFVAAESGRRYGAGDLRVAEDIAWRAALAVDNARAFEEAQRANRVKDSFLATLSHELRTPLNAILGYARMLRSGMLDGEKQARALEIVERSGASLAQIVEDVLDVSRIVTGKLRLNIQPVEVPVVVTDAVATVLPAAEAKEITVRTSIDPMVGMLSVDADRLQQVVWNLVSNAVKFTPRGGRVEVRVDRADNDVQIVVSDTGRGFASDFAPRLFDPFSQADSGFSREHGGLGLGLAIARHLVEVHGGTIQARSDGIGKGATFIVALPVPRVESAAGVQQMPALPAPFDTAAAAGLDGIRVLAVDDDADARAMVREILEAAGAHVTTVDSAESALEEIARVRPDALLADLGMPGVDGFELIARVRSSPDAEIRQVPAGALTAYARPEDRTKALGSGFQIHLAKPIDPAELIAAVALLARQQHPTAS